MLLLLDMHRLGRHVRYRTLRHHPHLLYHSYLLLLNHSHLLLLEQLLLLGVQAHVLVKRRARRRARAWGGTCGCPFARLPPTGRVEHTLEAESPAPTAWVSPIVRQLTFRLG